MSFAVEGAVQRANRRTEARVVFVRGRRTGAWTELTCVLLGLASVSQRSCETLGPLVKRKEPSFIPVTAEPATSQSKCSSKKRRCLLSTELKFRFELSP